MRALLLLIFGLSFFTPHVAGAAEPIPELVAIADYLATLPTIRVLVDSTVNQGHQISSLNLMAQVRALGFRGVFEILSLRDNLPKFSFLIPGFVPPPTGFNDLALQHFPLLGDVRFRFVEWDEVPSESVELAITGGFDKLEDTHYANARNFIILQPLNWPQFEMIMTEGQAYRIEDFGQRPIPAPMVTSADTETFFHTALAPTPELAPVASGLRELFRHRGEIDLMPVYGLRISRGAGDYLAAILRGLRASVSRAPDLFARPIVLPVLGDFLPYVKPEPGLQKIDIDSPALGRTLAELRPGDRLLVKVNYLPPNVFSYVISQATLPVVLEGKNLTTLVQQMGLPYFNFLGRMIDFGTSPADEFWGEAAAMRIIAPAFEAFATKPFPAGGALSDAQVNDFYLFLAATRDPHSVVRQFFARLAAPIAPAENKVVMAFTRYLQLRSRVLEEPADADCGRRLRKLPSGLRRYLTNTLRRTR